MATRYFCARCSRDVHISEGEDQYPACPVCSSPLSPAAGPSAGWGLELMKDGWTGTGRM